MPLTTLTEAQISKQIVDYCGLKHIPIFRNNVGLARYKTKEGSDRYVAFGEPGMADFTLILFIRTLGIELPMIAYVEAKTLKGKQSEKQKIFQRWCDSQRICYILARSVEDVEQGIALYLDSLPRF